ncbi:MAG: hypothetical protein ABI723_08255 [Bacteroidia bacterium]
MNKTIYILLFLLSAGCMSLTAQNIKDETVEYTYIKLPSVPLDRSVKNYQSSITATYEAENDKKKAEYEAKKKVAEEDYKKEKVAYPKKVKAAEEQYDRDMEEWKKKSLGQKIVEKEMLGEHNKPVKVIPPEPRVAYVPDPELKTGYDYPVLCNTYLHLDGFENKEGDDVKIQVTLYGYDYTQPRQMSVQKDNTRYANGKTQAYKATYYYTEFSYRHPMAVKVITPDGKEILNLTPQELNTYKIYKTAESETPPQINQQMLIKTYEEKILQDNLTYINNLVNDKFAYQRTKRSTKLYYVKSKDDTYKDLLIAFNEATAGLKILIDDAANAKTKLQSAIQSWNTALQESDPKNKKARIDKDVTIAVCFNLLEGYFALGTMGNVDQVISTLNGLDLSSTERKKKEDYEALFNDFKKRVQTNK